MSSFFFNDTATTEIYTLSLHDALPISRLGSPLRQVRQRSAGQNEYQRDSTRPCIAVPLAPRCRDPPLAVQDRKSTRLNSSHANISYAVFCLKKKNLSHLIHLYSCPPQQ